MKISPSYAKAYIAATACLFMYSCKQIEIFTHTAQPTDTYCLYKIGQVKNTGTLKALKKGEEICLYCTGATTCLLYTKQWINVVTVEGNPVPGQLFFKKKTGISYYLETDNPSASCTTCPGPNKFKIMPGL